MKTALVTGVNGQNGSYLAELLLEKGYKVVGTVRRASTNNTERIDHIKDNNFSVVECDITDSGNVFDIIAKTRPQEIYNTCGQSHVHTSFEQPNYTFQVNACGVLNLLEGIRFFAPSCRMISFNTSEMFGDSYSVEQNTDTPYDEPRKYQDENTRFAPRSPYAVSKMAAHNLIHTYRDSYNLFVCSSINFNNESMRRGENFVTRKITKYIGRLVNHKTSDKLKLGNIYAKRDWGHTKDTVRGTWLALQHRVPDDYVFCTGETHSVEEFLNEAFNLVNLDWHDYVEIDKNLFRPAEVDYLCGRADKAKRVLKWEPTVSFKKLVKEMVESDIFKYRNTGGLIPKTNNYIPAQLSRV